MSQPLTLARIGLIALLLASLLTPSALGAAYTTVSYNCDKPHGFGNGAQWEHKLQYFIEADGQGAFLATKDDAGTASTWTASSVESGVQSVPGAVQGTSPAPIKINLRGPAELFYLNLSKPIVGAVYVSGTTQSTGNAGREDAVFRIELIQGATTIGGVTCFISLGQTSRGAFPALHFRFRPEVEKITPSEPLRLEITRTGGLADFVIGTGGTTQSRIELRGWPHEPFQGPVAIVIDSRGVPRIEGLPDPPPQALFEPDPGLPGPEPGWLLLGIPLLALARPRRQSLALLLAAAVLAAGCLGGGSPSGSDPGANPTSGTPIIDEKKVDDEKLKEKGIGALQGRVHDNNNLSIKGAQILLVGSDLFTTTNNRGEFQFPNVTAGTYTIRIQHADFVYIERPVSIEVGKTTVLDVEMVRAGPDLSGTKPHVHPEFPEDGVLDLWTADFSLGGGTGTWTCDYNSQGCETMIPIDASKRSVPPGTGMIEAKLSFTINQGMKRMGIRIESPVNGTEDQYFLPRESSKVFRIPVFPNEADPGHQKFTNWIFYAYLDSVGPLNCGGTCVLSPAAAAISPPVTVGGSIHAEFKAYRGVLPFEPAHTDRWGNQTEIALLTNAAPTGGKSQTTALDDFPRDSHKMPVNGPEAFVPPGSAEIRGTLTWISEESGGVGITDWKILYKSASSPASQPVLKAPTTLTPGANKLEFVIKVDPKDVDPFYALDSGWAFYIDDGKEPTMVNGKGYTVHNGYFTTWKLTARVYKDPNYVFGGADA